MDSTKRFIKSSAIYFVGSVLTKLVAFFMLPLYTNYILIGDMGYYDLSVQYLNILVPVIGLEIWAAIMRFMFDYSDDNGKYKIVFNGFLINTLSIAVYSLGFLAFGIFTDTNYIILIFFYGLFTMLQNVYSFIARGLGYNVVFAVSGIIGGLTNSILNIVFILVFDMGIKSLYVSMIVSFVVQIVIMESKIHLLQKVNFKMFDIIIIKSMVRFSLPLCFNTVCFWFLSGYNHIGISTILGLEANGLYSIAAKFTLVLGLVSNCFSMAWQELVFSKGNEENKSEFYSTASNYYLKFLLLAILIFMPAVNIVFPYFIGPEYQDAFSLVPLYLLATAASIFSFFLGNIFTAEKKTNIVFASTIVSAVVNVALLHLLIGKIGIQAANVSLFSGFAVNIVIRILFLKRSVKIKLDYPTLAISLSLFAVSWYIYLTQGVLINIIFAFVVAAIFAFIFRELLKIGLGFLKTKILSKRQQGNR